MEPHDYERFPEFLEDIGSRRRNFFGCIDARDLGQIVQRCLQTDGLGYQVFNAGNNTNVADMPSSELMTRFFPGVPVTRKLDTHEAIFSNRKIREVLGFVEEHDWRKYVER